MPILASVAALSKFIAPFLPGVFRAANTLFGGKPKSGDEKMSWVKGVIRSAVDRLINANIPLPDGTVITENPTDDALLGMLEGLFQQFKAGGGEHTKGEEQQYFMVRGSVVPLRFGEMK